MSFRLIILLLHQLVPEGKFVIFPVIFIVLFVHNFKQFYHIVTIVFIQHNSSMPSSFKLYRFFVLLKKYHIETQSSVFKITNTPFLM